MKFAMNDSRPFTDYRSNCLLINDLEKKSSTTSSYDFRRYLQQNATKIMDDSRKCNFKTICPICKKMQMK